MSTFVIGDIHGNLKSLNQILERANITKEDTLIFLGDYVDRFPESAEVIHRLIELQETNPCIFIMGNHDIWLKDYLNKGIAPNLWITQGGRETIESYQKYFDNKEFIEMHRKFLNNMKPYYVDNKNRIFVHGGFTSYRGIEHEPYHTNYYWDRTLVQLAYYYSKLLEKNDNTPIPKILNTFNELYLGHTSTISWNDENGEPITTPIKMYNVWNLDTGGGYKGKLTIMNIDSKEYWQSDNVETLYT